MTAPTNIPTTPRPAMLSAAIISGLTALNVLVTLAVQVGVAALFGASGEMDVYFGALTLPVALGAILSGATVPAVIRVVSAAKARQGEESAWNDASALISIAVYAGTTAAVCAFIAAGPLLHLTVPGFSDSQHELARFLARLFWCAAVLQWFNSVLTAVHHANMSFSVPAAAPIAVPLGMLLTGWAFWDVMGVRAVAVGQLLGTVIQCVVLVTLWLRNGRFQVAPRANARIKRLVPMVVPLVFAGHLHLLLPVIERHIASELPQGSISYLAYAQRIATLISSITGYAIGSALFPKWAALVALGRSAAVGRSLTSALRILAIGIIPGVVFLNVFSDLIVGTIFQRGAFGPEATAGVAAALRWYVLAAVWMASGELIARAYFATGNTWAFAAIGVTSVVLYLPTSLMLAARFGFRGLAAAGVIYWTTFIGVLILGLCRLLGRSGWIEVARTTATALFMSSAAAVGASGLLLTYRTEPSALEAIGALTVGVLAYATAGLIVWRPSGLKALARQTYDSEYEKGQRCEPILTPAARQPDDDGSIK